MITPLQPIEVPAKTADGLWITNLSINAPSPGQAVRVTANVVPFVSQTGELIIDKRKQLEIEDLYALASTDADVAATIQALYATLQRLITDRGLFAPPAVETPPTEN
jgi:uncharacterized protein involved in propanediol utilization